MPISTNRRPGETADHSLPYCVARAIIDRKITTASFSDEKIHDPELKQVIHKIHGEASMEFEAMFPAKQPSRVTVKLKNGESHSVYLEYPKGDPREPMSREDIRNKYLALSAPLLSPERQHEIEQMVFDCEKFTARDFMAALTV